MIKIFTAPASRISSSFLLELEFNLFSVSFALMLNIEYRFGRYLYSLTCYLKRTQLPLENPACHS